MEDEHRERVDDPSSSSSSRVFPCMFCSRKFYSSQALGGHQNAHKKERTAVRKAKRASEYATTTTRPHNFSSASPLPMVFSPPNHHLGLLHPSVYITAHAANFGHFPSSSSQQQFSDSRDKLVVKSNGGAAAARFENPAVYGGGCPSPHQFLHEDEPSFLNWQTSVRCDEHGGLSRNLQASMEYNQQIGSAGSAAADKGIDSKLDLSLHL